MLEFEKEMARSMGVDAGGGPLRGRHQLPKVSTAVTGTVMQSKVAV